MSQLRPRKAELTVMDKLFPRILLKRRVDRILSIAEKHYRANHDGSRFMGHSRMGAFSIELKYQSGMLDYWVAEVAQARGQFIGRFYIGNTKGNASQIRKNLLEAHTVLNYMEERYEV